MCIYIKKFAMEFCLVNQNPCTLSEVMNELTNLSKRDIKIKNPLRGFPVYIHINDDELS
jgi:hypothetical protein